MKSVNELNESINRVAVAIENIDDETERKMFRRLLAEVMGGAFDLIMPIIKQHPELDPDKGGEDSTG